MINLKGFDARKVAPMKGPDPVPPDNYSAVITDSCTKPTKSGNGEFLELIYQIIEGEYKGRRIWSRLNLNNPSPKAVELAYAELSSLCHAVGVMQPLTSKDLHDIPLIITVRHEKRPDTGEIVNKVRGYAKKDDVKNPPVQDTNTTPPW